MDKSGFSQLEIVFPNGNRAVALKTPTGAAPAEAATSLNLRAPQSVIVLAGGAGHLDAAIRERLAPFFNRGIARAAEDMKAVIIDGGTQAGVMELMGSGIADRGRITPLIGVAPTGKAIYPGGPDLKTMSDAAPLDPNHSHFVLVQANEWGEETSMIVGLAASFQVPVVMILVNGGEIARREVLQAARKEWPVIIMKGSGRLADQLADLREQKPDHFDDPVIEEIITTGTLRIFPSNGTLEDLEHLMASQTSNADLLAQAWRRFFSYDQSARSFQRNFRQLQIAILFFGVLGVFLAVVQQEIAVYLARHQVQIGDLSINFGNESGAWVMCYKILRYCLIVVPIVTSVLFAISHRLRQGNKWVILRASAEAVKREIFAYRTRAGAYGEQSLNGQLREDKFEAALENVTRRLARTEVNRTALADGVGEPGNRPSGDDGMSTLTPERYVALRLDDQLAYFRAKTTKLERELRWLQILILVAGGVGTFLAAINLELWITLTTALATAFTSYLAYQQTEQTLVQYNQTAADLENLRSWWTKLTPAEKRNSLNIDRLVEFTERSLETEMIGWGQRMEDVLAKLRAPDTKKDGREEGNSGKGKTTADSDAANSSGESI